METESELLGCGRVRGRLSRPGAKALPGCNPRSSFAIGGRACGGGGVEGDGTAWKRTSWTLSRGLRKPDKKWLFPGISRVNC